MSRLTYRLKLYRICAQPTLRPLYLSMSAAWIMSTSELICMSPNICFSIENTRSAAAELGVNEPFRTPPKTGNVQLSLEVRNCPPKELRNDPEA